MIGCRIAGGRATTWWRFFSRCLSEAVAVICYHAAAEQGLWPQRHARGEVGGREVVEKARKLREADYLVAALDSVGLSAGARPDFPG